MDNCPLFGLAVLCLPKKRVYLPEIGKGLPRVILLSSRSNVLRHYRKKLQQLDHTELEMFDSAILTISGGWRRVCICLFT